MRPDKNIPTKNVQRVVNATPKIDFLVSAS